MEIRFVLVPAQDRQNVVTALVVYAWLVFGLAKSTVALALSKGLLAWTYEIPERALGGLTVIPFAIMLIATLLVFRKVAAGGNPAGRAVFGRWLLQGAFLFAVLGVGAAAIETVFLGAVVPALKLSFGPEARGTIGVAVVAILYAMAALIAYRWAKRRVDAR